MTFMGNADERALETLKSLLIGEERSRLDGVRERVRSLEARAGDDVVLQASVTRIIAGALRDAEIERHEDLARSMAPVVVATIRSEITNSRDQMVEALYPITGQLVSAYVSNAMRDLMADINRRLESGLSARRYYLRLKSIVTGRPYSDLVLAELNAPRIEELYLIRRGSGELIDTWVAPKPINSADGDVAEQSIDATAPVDKNNDALVGSFLTALTDFARDAFRADEGALQTLDLKTHIIYLRASPAHLIAAKCNGNVPRNIERALDGVFVDVLSRHADALAAAPQTTRSDLLSVLPDFASKLENELADISSNQRGGSGLATGALGLIAAGVLGWFAWTTFVDWRETTVRDQVTAIKRGLPAFQGYPVTVDVSEIGRNVALEGLSPSLADRDELLNEVRAKVSPRVLHEAIAVVPDLGTARELAGRTDSLTERLLSVEGAIEGFNSGAFNRIAAQFTTLQEALRGVEARTATLDGRLAAIAQSAETEAAKVEGIEAELGRGEVGQLRVAVGVLSQDIAAMRNDLATTAGNDDVTRVVALIETVSRRMADLERQLDLEPMTASLNTLGNRMLALERELSSPKERLDAFVRQNAVFFDNGIEFRDDASTRRAVRQLAQILIDGKLPIRIVGYTDDAGNPSANQVLGAQRAERVADLLKDFGVTPGQILTVGRAELFVLSNNSGPGSPNRRVEFEHGFAGE